MIAAPEVSMPFPFARGRRHRMDVVTYGKVPLLRWNHTDPGCQSCDLRHTRQSIGLSYWQFCLLAKPRYYYTDLRPYRHRQIDGLARDLTPLEKRPT